MIERILRISIQRRGFVLCGVVAMADWGSIATRGCLSMRYQTLPMYRYKSIRWRPGIHQWKRNNAYLSDRGGDGRHTPPGPYRSISRYGLSQVTVIFDDGTDIYFARQLVNQRIQEAQGNLPAGIVPTMGPILQAGGNIHVDGRYRGRCIKTGRFTV